MVSALSSSNVVAQLNAFGLKHISFVERPLQRLEPAEIRVYVGAASLNHRDLMVVGGRFPDPPKLPLVPLSDCAGEVVEIGRNVTRFKIGDRVVPTTLPAWVDGPYIPGVIATGLGSGVDGVLSKYFDGDQRGFVLIPEGLSLEEAATLPCAALTAWNALFEQGNLKPGQTVLVQGSGGVSIFALQFALASGARVIATTGSESKVGRLLELGASHVINYRRSPDWSEQVLEVTGGTGVDHLVETGGAGTLDQSIKATAVGGAISVIGMLTGAYGTFDTMPILRKTLRLQGIITGSVDMLERMNGTIETLGIHPVIDRTFEMHDIVPALEYLASGQHVGKIVVRMTNQ
jgi:NADPH:quinone reductase-like Zn-dependent oxidoreductase